MRLSQVDNAPKQNGEGALSLSLSLCSCSNAVDDMLPGCHFSALVFGSEINSPNAMVLRKLRN